MEEEVWLPQRSHTLLLWEKKPLRLGLVSEPSRSPANHPHAQENTYTSEFLRAMLCGDRERWSGRTRAGTGTVVPCGQVTVPACQSMVKSVLLKHPGRLPAGGTGASRATSGYWAATAFRVGMPPYAVSPIRLCGSAPRFA